MPPALGVFALAAAIFVTLLVGPLVQGLGILGLPIAALAAVTPALLLARTQPGSIRDVLALSRPSLAVSSGAVLIGASYWLVNITLVAPLSLELFGGLDEMNAMAAELESTALPLLILSLAITPALTEEILFRGVLARSLESPLGRTPAILISATLFAAIHLPVARMMPALTIGLILGFVALRSGSTLAAMLVHLVNNAAALVLTRLELDFLDETGAVSWSVPMVIAVAVAVLATLLGMWLITRCRPISGEIET